MTEPSAFDHKAFLSTVSELPGVYRMLDARGTVMYVGKAKNLKKRLSSYFRKTGLTTRLLNLVNSIHHIETINTRTEAEALLLENDLIKNLNPRYNVLFRDDKSYPYICLTRHRFPRLRVFRGRPDRKKGEFFGPYPSAGAIRYTINYLQRIFQLRNCEDSAMLNRSRACLQYQIKRCTGPCVGHVDEASYQQQIEQARLFLKGESDKVIAQLAEQMEQYSDSLAFEEAATIRDRIDNLRRVTEKQFVTNFQSDMDIVACEIAEDVGCIQLFMIRNGTSLGNKAFYHRVKLDSTEADMIGSFLIQHYSRHPAPAEIIVSHQPPDVELIAESLQAVNEKAIKISSRVRDKRRKALDGALENARQSLASYLASTSVLNKRFNSMVEMLGLESVPERIECFDISHTMGESTKASCVVFNTEGANKSDYRRYNISGIEPGDDYAAMEQVLQRRYAKAIETHAELPDLILIDGGKGQLNMALKVLESLDFGQHKDNFRMFAISKGPERRAGYEQILDESGDPLAIAIETPGLLMLQQIRDEAHRFAITGHRQARAKARRKSTLEDIPGVGSKKRQLLLSRFGGLQGVKSAGVEELASVKGINQKTAQAIYDMFHR